MAQKYAVRVGGGDNHRMGLYDAVMLKENHVRAAGSHHGRRSCGARRASGTAADRGSRRASANCAKRSAAGCDRILIDDFDAATRREAVRIAADPRRIPLEVSGGVDLAGLRAIAEDGVDCISIGALTKHVRAIDLSMKLGPRRPD